MSPEEYDAWYQTPRGSWIGETEYRFLTRLLAPAPGESLLDVGCGTGYFTRRFARFVERILPGWAPWAGFLLAAGDVMP